MANHFRLALGRDRAGHARARIIPERFDSRDAIGKLLRGNGIGALSGVLRWREGVGRQLGRAESALFEIDVQCNTS